MPLANDDLKFNFGCASCGYQAEDAPLGRIEVARMTEKLDALFDRNDLDGAGRLLDYWHAEARRLRDERGELSVLNEEIGYFRKTENKEKAEEAICRALFLLKKHDLESALSGATLLLNIATTKKAFGQAREALPIYEAVLAVYREKLPEGDARMGGLYNNYALALADEGKIKEAEAAYRQAIAVMTALPDGKPEAAVSYINLAQVYGQDEEKSGEDILSCMETAYRLLSDKENARNGNYFFVLSKCAPALREAGFIEEADDMERQVKEFYERP